MTLFVWKSWKLFSYFEIKLQILYMFYVLIGILKNFNQKPLNIKSIYILRVNSFLFPSRIFNDKSLEKLV
jgi:hypothetical protein